MRVSHYVYGGWVGEVIGYVCEFSKWRYMKKGSEVGLGGGLERSGFLLVCV